MNILITGATGYIGRHILKRLTDENHYCRCLVRDKSNVDSIKDFKNVELFYGDISQKNTLTHICKGIDVVINSAGILGKWNSTLESLRPVNAYGIINLSDEIAQNNVGYVVHLSAGGVTGPVHSKIADESYICKPMTPYEISKWEGEKNALRLYHERTLPITVVRPTFTYGLDDPHKLPLFKSIIKRRFIFIGKGDSLNHPVYIDDLVEGIMLLLERRPIGELFIIGGPHPVTKMDLVNTIGEELGVKTDFMHIPKWITGLSASIMVYLARFFNFDPILTPSRVSMMADNWGYSIKKAKEELGYSPQTELKEGIAMTVKTYKQLGWL